MTDTLRQQIVDAIIARLQTINTANGYATDIGERVEDWPRRFEEAELAELTSGAALGVCDLTAESDRAEREARLTLHQLPVQIRIFATTDTPARTLRAMLGDVIQCVGQDDTWGGLALDSRPVRDGFIIPSEAMEIAGAAVEIEVSYQTATHNPF